MGKVKTSSGGLDAYGRLPSYFFSRNVRESETESLLRVSGWPAFSIVIRGGLGIKATSSDLDYFSI